MSGFHKVRHLQVLQSVPEPAFQSKRLKSHKPRKFGLCSSMPNHRQNFAKN